MTNSLIKIILILSLFFLLGSCKKWLDVKPEDRFIEEELFKSEQGFADVLNGIYLNMGSSDMYGGRLTMTTMDILAQYYNISSSQTEYRQALSTYAYQQENIISEIDGIWTKHFTTITGTNEYIANLDKYGSVLSDQSFHLFKAEAYALRALLYFDILRMFAPAYTQDSTAVLIPYYDHAGADISEFQSSIFVMNKIVNDLKVAETLLEQYDPAIDETTIDKTRGPVETGHRSWMTFRNYRLNYYAVKALQARVNLWRGDKKSALQAANVVIENQSKFPWITLSQINQSDFPNRIFSTEMLFGVENSNLYNFYNTNFNPSLEDNRILAAGTGPGFLNQIYDNQESDFRYDPLWKIEGGKTYRVFVKYKNMTNTVAPNFRFTIPMIRLAEVYLIAAECEENATDGMLHLNTLRTHRNVAPVTDPSLLKDQIMREYRKEFFGEGQLWFYYKRNNMTSILSATTANMMNINPEKYVFPIPLSETDPR